VYEETSSTLELPAVPPASTAGPAASEVTLSRSDQFWDAVRHPKNHKQAFRFLCVGGSGYVVNNVAFAVLQSGLSVQHTVAFWVASLIGTANNFWWNRNWTFDAKHHHIGKQGMRFLSVSMLVAGLAYVIYLGLVAATGMPKLPANALAYVIATPFSFIAQKLWSFKA
jgi:putative flippase GtrA